MDSMNDVSYDLSSRLGHEMELKDEQKLAIEHLLCGRDVLCSFAHWFRQKFNFPAIRQDVSSK